MRIRVFSVASFALCGGALTILACADDAIRDSFGEGLDASDGPEASLPPVSDDAGAADVQTTLPKPDYDASDEPVVCTSTPCATQLVAGWNHFCALVNDGSVRCWGSDFSGALGRGELGVDQTGTRPAPVVGVTDATQISAGGATTCVRTATGSVQCWGSNDNGQLGLQVSPAVVDWDEHPTPAAVAVTAEISRVDVAINHVCAVGTKGEVYCWGENENGLLARPDASTSYEDIHHGPGMSDLHDHAMTRVVGGRLSAFGLTRDGKLVGWGQPSGRESSLTVSEPFVLPTLSDVSAVAIAIGDRATCAIASGEVYCWGYNDKSQLGTGHPGGLGDRELLPTLAKISTDGGAFPQQLALSSDRSCVRMTDGTIRCCGYDGYNGTWLGHFGGDAGTKRVMTFEPIPTLKSRAVQVAAGIEATCALLQGGKVACWGGNSFGQLGQGSIDWDGHPIPVIVDL